MLLKLSCEYFERDNRCGLQMSNLAKTTRETRWGAYASRQ